jgi:mono/diheme cytochrome c family protein
MPAGFTKKTIGFPRVANNCAICHAQSYRTKPGERPIIVPVGGNHTFDAQAMLRFLTNCAKDPRFNADTLLAEIEQHADFSWLDRLAWRYLIIPQARKALLAREGQFGWMNRPYWPDWGPGRDDPMNLTKYFMTNMKWDDSVGSADFPSIWNLGLREGKNLNWGGETPSPLSVIIDSALGLQADPKTVVAHARWILEYASKKRAPKYPYPVDAALAAKGKPIYDAQCASCHAFGAARTGTVIPIEEIGTDRNRLITWTQEAADKANAAVTKLGIQRIGLIKTNGYQAIPLDGIWLRAPYLHNGSVPNLREMLEPPEKRSKVFYRGYDVYDPVNVGFDSQSAEAQRAGFKVDTATKGNGNQGHLYGTKLAQADKTALIEYMKTIGPVEGEP